MGRWKTYFSLEGRASRLAFWRFLLLQTMISAGLMAATSFATIAGGWLGVIPAILIVPLLVAGFCVVVRRLHDRGKSAIWAVIFTFGPFALAAPSGLIGRGASSLAVLGAGLAALASLVLALWSWIELGVLVGQKGSNRYGPDPSTRSSAA